jgi:hypothetical protein
MYTTSSSQSLLLVLWFIFVMLQPDDLYAFGAAYFGQLAAAGPAKTHEHASAPASSQQADVELSQDP